MRATRDALPARVEADETIFNPNKHRLLDARTAVRPRAGEVWIERSMKRARGAPNVSGGKALRTCRGRAGTSAGGCSAAERRLRDPRDTHAAAIDGLLCNPAIEKGDVA